MKAALRVGAFICAAGRTMMKATTMAAGVMAVLLASGSARSVEAQQASQTELQRQMQEALMVLNAIEKERSRSPEEKAADKAKADAAVKAAVEEWKRIVASSRQGPPGTGERFVVVLQQRAMSGTFPALSTDQPDRCTGVDVGFDSLVGVVERRAIPTVMAEAVEYYGILGRTTRTGLCEVRTTNDGDRWCAGILNGSGPVEVTILLPGDQGRDDGEVQLTPVAKDTTVAVTGSCSSLDNAAVEAQYRGHDGIAFDRLPHDRLKHGDTYTNQKGAVPWSEGPYTMWVSQVGAAPATPPKK